MVPVRLPRLSSHYEHPSKRKSVNKNNSIVAIYPSHTAAEAAIKELQQSGFDMKKLSVVGRDYHMDDTTHAKEILNRTKPETLEHHQ